MRRDLVRRQLSRLIVWTGIDGPVPVACGVVGAEYRGRLGHPSSYGLLMARAADSPGVQFDLSPASVALSVPCDEVTPGLTEPEYRAALYTAGHDLRVGLVVTGAVERKLGSSVVVFTRLAAVLSVLLAVGAESVDATTVWATWDEAWPGRSRP